MEQEMNQRDLIRANDLKGPADLYEMLLVLKTGFSNGGTLGCYSITKAQAKRACISWEFVVSSCEVLGLKLSNRHGRWGHIISLP
jgi:hypothetical protein